MTLKNRRFKGFHMKKIIISLTFIIGSLSQTVFGAMVPAHANLALCASPSLLASMPTASAVTVCTANQTHARVFTQDEIYSTTTPLIAMSSVDISPAIIQDFFYANGINLAREQAQLSLTENVDLQQLNLLLDRMTNTFEQLAHPVTGTFGFFKKMYRALKKSNLEQYIESLANKMKDSEETLRLDISELENVQPIFIKNPANANVFYTALAALLRNLKSSFSDKTKECPASLFNFGIHIEQVDLTTATLDHQETPTEAHALTWCEKVNPECKRACCGNTSCKPCTRTFACAMNAMSNTKIERWDNSLDQTMPHLRRTFTTIHQRSQLFSQTHHEFFHGYDGKYGMLFDVMTEVAKRLDLLDSANQSPLLLRLSSGLFNLHARNVEHFLTQTWPQTPSDHNSLIKTLILSVNVALGGNFYQNGECTLKYWLNNISITDLDLGPLLTSIVSMFGLTPQEAKNLSEKIIAIYNQYPELNTGHLLQIFVPQGQTNDLAYMSLPMGIPYDTSTPTTKALAEYPTEVKTLFYSEDARQARLILRPDANLPIYRYYRTQEAQTAAPKALSELQALLDIVATQHEGKIPRLVEQIRFGKAQAIQQAQELLSHPSTHITPETGKLAQALLEKNIKHPFCQATLARALATPQDQDLTLAAYNLFKTLVTTSSNIHLADPLTATGIDLVVRILQTSKNDDLKDDVLSLHISQKIDTLPLDKQIIFASYGMLAKDKSTREHAINSFKELCQQNIKAAYTAAFNAAINALTISRNADIETNGFELLETLFNDVHTLEHLDQQNFYAQSLTVTVKGIQSLDFSVREKATKILTLLSSRGYADVYTATFKAAINAITNSHKTDIEDYGFDLLETLFNDIHTLEHLDQRTFYTQALAAAVQRTQSLDFRVRAKAIRILTLLITQGFPDVYKATANAVNNAFTTDNNSYIIIDNFKLLIKLINNEHTIEHVPQEQLYAQALTVALANIKSIEYYHDHVSEKAKDVLAALKKHGYTDAYTKSFAFGYDAVMKSNNTEMEQVGLELLHDLLNDEHTPEHLQQEEVYRQTLEATLHGLASTTSQTSYKAYPILKSLFDKNYAPAFMSSFETATTMIAHNQHVNYALWVLDYLIQSPHTLINIK